MAASRLIVSPGFLLLAAFLYYAGGGAAALAFFTAALAHELGHLAVLAAAGARVRRVRLGASGAVIEYGGELSRRQELAAAAAGPVAGLLFAAFCAGMGTPYFRYAGAIALLASAFNLLPALPLDGGRIALLLLEEVFSPEAARRFLGVTGAVCGAGIALTGGGVGSPAACAAGIWLALLAIWPRLR